VKRRLFTILSAVSLLLCTAVCWMWTRSIAYIDLYHYQLSEWESEQLRSDHYFYLVSRPGEFEFGTMEFVRDKVFNIYLFYGWAEYETNPAKAWASQRLGISGSFSPTVSKSPSYTLRHDNTNYWNIRLPYWLLIVLFSILPIVWLGRRLRERRRIRRLRRHQCASCGYDLRATPGRCPECGTVADASHEAVQS
jgi:hypothetical protein